MSHACEPHINPVAVIWMKSDLYSRQLFNIAPFLKSVLNFVWSNDIQCKICVDQSYEILSLLYYRYCFNLWKEVNEYLINNINFEI